MQEGECGYNKGVAIDVDGKDVVLDVDSMVNFMEEKLASTRGKPSYRPTIFTVPEDIRDGDAAAYSPKVVSIGLLQQETRRLDEHKWHYLDKVLSRSKNNLNVYIKEMKKTSVEAGFCYSGFPESGGLAIWFEQFLKMLLVDGCFIINLLLQLEDGFVEVEINDPIYSNRWMLPRVGHDMLLLENQLPFFVLEKLWELTGRERPALKTKVLQFFRILLPELRDLELPETEDVHHLLHLIHLSLQPSPSKKPKPTSGTTIPGSPQPGDTLSSTKNSFFESPESLQSTSPAMTSQPVNVPRLQIRANLMPHDPTPSGLEQTPPGLRQIPREQQTKPESTGGTTIPNPPQPIDTLSSTKNSSFESPKPLQPASPQPIDTLSSSKNSSFESPKPLQPASPTEKPESASGATGPQYPVLPMPVIPSDPSTSKSSPFIFYQPVILREERFPIPSGLIQIQMSEQRPLPKTVPSATELQEAGVKFQRKKARSFLDVTFERGLMQMPCLTISDSTNSLFRNFIAFEQSFPDCGSHFTSYCIFMDSLINTPRDVEILKQSGVIEHVLGSDEEVALLFNKLSRGITCDYENSYLAKVYNDVEDHTQKKWPMWRAKLVRDYFSNPWAILSLIAAIVILILTFLQTYFAVFAYFRPPKA